MANDRSRNFCSRLCRPLQTSYLPFPVATPLGRIMDLTKPPASPIVASETDDEESTDIEAESRKLVDELDDIRTVCMGWAS